MYKPFSSSAYRQRGRGLGSIFKSIVNIAGPLVRRGISALARVGKSKLVKTVANDLKNTAIRTGLELASTAIKPGENKKEKFKDVVKANVSKARENIGKRLAEIGLPQPKRRKKKTGQDLFS